ncbi:MAG: hypothetical protein AAFQ37_11710, partial [Bacteroidota bacterium]
MTWELSQKYEDRLRTHTIEVRQTANGRITIQPDEILRNQLILGIFVTDNTAGGIIAPSGRALASKAAQDSATLNLLHGNDQILSNHPLSDLVRQTTDNTLRIFNYCRFNPSKSVLSRKCVNEGDLKYGGRISCRRIGNVDGRLRRIKSTVIEYTKCIIR